MSDRAAVLVAVWTMVDAWLIYGAMQHVFWRIG